MGSKDYYRAGSWNAFCMRCGRKFKADELKKEWTGIYVCPECWEPRNAQDLIRPIGDPRPPPWTAPRPPAAVSPFQGSQDKYVINGYMTADAMIG